MSKVKHMHEYIEQKSGIKVCACGRFKHKEGGVVIVEQRVKHTPGPWRALEFGETISIDQTPNGEKNSLCVSGVAFINPRGNSNAGIPSAQDRANARFIVRACNSHEELLEACKLALLILGDTEKSSGIKQAIAKAEGR